MIERRTYLVLTAGSLASFAGCLTDDDSTSGSAATNNSRTDSPEAFTDPNNWGENPVTVGLTTTAPAPQEIHNRIEVALEYWQNNSERYTEQTVEFEYRPNADEPDVDIEIVGEIEACGPHDSDMVIVGCAPIIEGPVFNTSTIQIRSDLEGDHLNRVLKHELGHVLGLTHDDEPQHIMSDKIERRIPDFSDRKEILETYTTAIHRMNTANSYYEDGLLQYEKEEFATAQEKLSTANSAYHEASAKFTDASEVALQLDEKRVVELCEEAADTSYEFALSMNALQRASEAYESHQYDRGDDFIDEHQNHHSTARGGTVRSRETVAELLGLPT